MLAILNMILMGDESSNILNEDSLKDFDRKYGFIKTEEDFPATAFVLNSPYSADGNGMIFVKKALSMMKKGYASVIIQNSAGSGKAKEINKEIYGKYAWTYKANWAKVKNDKIFLPIKNNEIDYKYMEIFVSAIQKEVIENVVKYLDLKIETTKKVVFDD